MMRAPIRLSRHSPWFGAARSAPSRLVRVAVWTIALEAVLLVGLGVSAVAPPTKTGRPRGPVADVAGFELTRAHGLLLVVTGLLALAALRRPAWQLGFAAGQTVAYLLITVLGVLLPRTAWWQLNLADHLLHAALFLLGVTLWALLRAGPPAHTGHPTRADTESDPAGSDTHR